ncbi:MAG: PLP-dependent aminotransferase family protein [Rhodospirillales bacterium]
MSFDWSSVFAGRAARMGASEIRELLKVLEEPDVISFAGGIPDPELFPIEAFKTAYNEALSTKDSASRALQYSVSEGAPELKRWIASYMGSRAMPCGPENILITCGSQQGLEFLGRIMLSPGDRALVAWPTYLGALQAFNAYEPEYARLGVRDNAPANERPVEGEKAKFAYIVPDFDNPTGRTLSIDERKRVLERAKESGGAVIEDAAYTELRYEGEAMPSLLALDMQTQGSINQSRVIYCGTFSKTLSPGLRVGWIAASASLIDKLVLVKQASDLHSPTLNQMAVAAVAETNFNAQLDKIRNAYRIRRDAMLSALSRHMPEGFSWSRPEGGMFVWVEGPRGMNGRALLQRAVKREKVAFVPGQAFFADGSGQECMRLSFSLANPDEIEEGVLRLARAIPE